MTYRELLQHLSELTEDKLDQDVTVHIESQNEFYAVTCIATTDVESDVLDPGHLFFKVPA